ATLASWLGMIFTGWLSQRIGRKKAMIIFAGVAVGVVIPMAIGILGGGMAAFLFVIIYAFVVSTASGPVPAFFSERFPTEIRNSAAGFSYNAGLIFGSWSPLIALTLMSLAERSFAPIVLGLNIIIGAVIVIVPTLLSPETKENELT
ncbi:MAG: MFS transporter, partial [Nitrosopumilaceae archaeon]|nr:MFS transporter [Nitrosopumilaceae archaeon]